MTPAIPLAAILAGGKSRRMGRDKARLEFLGVPLIERVRRVATAVAQKVIVVGGAGYLADKGVPTVPDRFPGASALGGVATALGWAREKLGPGTWVLCLACDLPLVRPELLSLLWDLRDEAQVVVPRVEAGYEPLVALYREDGLGVLEEQIRRGDLSILRAFPRLRTVEVGEEILRRADPELRSFLNLNRPEDVERALRLATPSAGAGASGPGTSPPGGASRQSAR